MNNKSFTMIELIVAMTIVLIISIVGTINYLRSYDTLKLDAAAQRIASDIRYAQSLVIDRNAQSKKTGIAGVGNGLVVDFSISQNCYYIVPFLQTKSQACQGSGAETSVTYVPIADPLTHESLTLDFDTSTEYKGVYISNLSLGATDGPSPHAISFSDPGAVVKTGYWYCTGSQPQAVFLPWYDLFSAGGTITLSFRGKTKTIRISQTIGRVTIE